MVTVGGGHPFLLPRTARPPILPHDPGDLLAVHDPPFTVELFGDPSVSIAWKLETEITDTIYEGFLRGCIL